MEARQLLEVLLHVLLLQVLGKRRDVILLDTLLGEAYGASNADVLGTEVPGIGDVHEVMAILPIVSEVLFKVFNVLTYATKLPLLVLRHPRRLARRELDQEGLFGMENDVIGLDLLDESGGNGGKACRQEGSLGKLHNC